MTFRIRLLLGSAFPLLLALPAFAQTQITTATTSSVSTSTADDGAADDIEITDEGSITLEDADGAVAVTVDSNNSLVNDGIISITDSNNAVGVRVLPNLTTGFSGEGSISVLEDYTREDDDDDDDVDGPLAVGTGRVGLLVESGGTMTGDIITSGGAITVEGNDSFGVSVRSLLNGSYRQAGSVSVTGSNGIALDVREDVSGDVILGGSVNALGESTIGARFLGDVGGEFAVNGSIYATGFTSTSVTNYADPDELDEDDTPIEERLDADDLLIGGPALLIRGDLTKGFLVNGAAIGGLDPTEDEKDVVQDFNENRSTGYISVFGSASALLIQPLDGSDGDELRLGLVHETVLDTLDDDEDDDVAEVIGAFDYNYGFINRGSISASGLNVGISANAVTIAGSADGMHQTIIEGGIYNGGTVSATAFEANATGFLMGNGAAAPEFINTGSILATVYTETDDVATGMLVDVGANLPSFDNKSYLGASVRGYDGDAIAFQDLSGTVTSFTNSSQIVAGFIDDDEDDDITSGLGRAIALDLSHSTSDVTLTQSDTAGNARLYGDILFGVGDDRFDLLSGEVHGDISFGTGLDTFVANNATMYGDVTFDGTAASVSFNDAALYGALTLGSAATALSFLNNSVFYGDITASGPVTLTVDHSGLGNTATSTLNLQSLSFANGSTLGIVVDNDRIASGAPVYNVAGVASLSADTIITPVVEQFSSTPFSIRIMDAATLNLGGDLSAMLSTELPYIYKASLSQATATSIDLNMSVKSAAELELNARQSGAYTALLDLMEQDDDVASAVGTIATGNDFRRSWSDLLPSSDAAVMSVLATNATASFGATAHRLDFISEKPDAPGGAWTEEFAVVHASDPTDASVGIEGAGYSVAAGIDVLSDGEALIGVYGSLESVRVEEEDRTGAPLSVTNKSLGAYGGWKKGYFALNGAASVGLLNFTSKRQVAIGDFSDTVRGEWGGQSYSLAGRATYKFPLGLIDVTPFVAADFIGFRQDGYTEAAVTDDALAIVASESDASLSTASYGLSVRGNFGRDDAYGLSPELSVGYRKVLGWENSPSLLRYAGASSGTTFQLDPGAEPEDSVVAGIGLRVDSQFLNIKIGYDAEIGETSTTHYGSVTLRIAFW